MTRRPLIGVTVSRRSGWRIFPLIALNLWLAGGRAVKWQRPADVVMARVDGIIIGGGDDIAPTLYDGEVRMQARLDHARDRLEAALIRMALARGLPVLGICRGAQMLNVVEGGTLEQDAFGRFGSRRYRTILPRRTVRIDADSRLGRIVGPRPMKVNALHSQAVDRLGTDLAVCARDEKGMVQAVERRSDPFAIGVQWHPEHLFYARRHLALFRALVEAARACHAGRRQIPAAADPAFAATDPAPCGTGR